MSKAKTFSELFNQQPRDEDGMYKRSPNDLLAHVGWMVNSSQPDGNDSPDSTELWEFGDGSRLHVGNPRQLCFAGNVYEVEASNG